MNLAPLRAVVARLSDPRLTPLGYQPLREATDPDAAHSDFRSYRLAGGAKRDRDNYSRRAVLERGMELLDTQPMLARYVSFLAEWIKPTEFRPRCVDPRLQEIVDEFFGDPRSGWRSLLSRLLWVKAAAGEIFLPAQCGIDGRVVVGYFDPADIVEVKMRAGSSVQVESIVYGPGSIDSRTLRVPAIGAGQDQRDEETFGRLVGVSPTDPMGSAQRLGLSTDEASALAIARLSGVLCFRWNCPPNASRGRSDFMSSIDHLTVLDDFHFAVAERAQTAARFMGDVEITGGVQQDIDAARMRYRNVPGAAIVAFHNEQEKWNLGAPNLNSADTAEQERMFRAYATASLGIPPHILSGDMSAGSHALGTDTHDPLYMRVESKAKELADVLETACRYAIDCMRLFAPGRVAGIEDWSLSIDMPPLLRRDPQAMATRLGAVASALSAGRAERFVDRESARDVYLTQLEDLAGAPIDRELVAARLAGEAGEFDAATADRLRTIAKDVEAGVPAPAEEPEPRAAPTPEPAAAIDPDAITAAQVLNGAQIAQARELVVAVAAGQLPRDAALGMLQVFFNLALSKAQTILGSVGRGFEQAEAPVAEAQRLDLSEDCGTGAGGFKPGNKCAPGGGSGSAARFPRSGGRRSTSPEVFDTTPDGELIVYHGGKTKVTTIDPAMLQSRDYGFYGEGFYVASNRGATKGYGKTLSAFAVDKSAKILWADAGPDMDGKWTGDPALRKKVKEYFTTGPPAAAAAARGKTDEYMADIELLDKSPIEWKNAVDRYGTATGYDIIVHHGSEIVVKNTDKLRAIKTPKKNQGRSEDLEESAVDGDLGRDDVWR